MIDELNKVFKEYVSIFIQEYTDYLSIEQLDLLKSINFNNAIKLDSTSKPFGIISLGQINLSDYSEELINNLKKMPSYNSKHDKLNNKNLASYLRYMCDSGYSLLDYYSDILMYFVFKLVIKNSNGLINGLINREIKTLASKYSFRFANLYPREEAIVSKLTKFLDTDECRKIIFSDNATSFKYLNDNKGFRFAELIDNVQELIDDEYQELSNKDYNGYTGFLDYTVDYDNLSYGSVYNCILNYEAENELANNIP